MKKQKNPDFDRGHGSMHLLCSLTPKLSLALKHTHTRHVPQESPSTLASGVIPVPKAILALREMYASILPFGVDP